MLDKVKDMLIMNEGEKNIRIIKINNLFNIVIKQNSSKVLFFVAFFVCLKFEIISAGLEIFENLFFFQYFQQNHFQIHKSTSVHLILISYCF